MVLYGKALVVSTRFEIRETLPLCTATLIVRGGNIGHYNRGPPMKDQLRLHTCVRVLFCVVFRSRVDQLFDTINIMVETHCEGDTGATSIAW